MTENFENKDKENWYPFYTKPRHEFKALEQIKAMGIKTFLPTITIVKQWSDRKKKITEPLFKSYIFIKGTEQERNMALTADAVVKSIFFNGKPATVNEKEMEDLMQVLKSPEKLKVFNGIAKGVKIKIESGPLKGVEGFVEAINKEESRLLLAIEMLNRTVSVVIPESIKITRIK
jgi:transcription antitermination factor NusG